jgi:hypothetical protein
MASVARMDGVEIVQGRYEFDWRRERLVLEYWKGL